VLDGTDMVQEFTTLLVVAVREIDPENVHARLN
jgi:hypothetical protein